MGHFALKSIIRSCHFTTFLLLAAIVYMGGQGAINFDLPMHQLIHYIKPAYVLSVVVLTIIATIMIISTEWVFSENLKKARLGILYLLIESLFLTFAGYQIDSISQRMFGPVCMTVGAISIVLSIVLFIWVNETKKEEVITFNRKELLKLPNWKTSFKSVVFVVLAFLFGAHQSYFGTSFFGMFVGWSVGNTLVAKQYPLLHAIKKQRLDDVQKLVNQGYSVNGKRYLNKNCMGTPIEYAVIHGREDKVTYLLDQGVTMETCRKHPVHQMISRTTHNKNEELFLRKGLADPNQTYNGEYPLNLTVNRCINVKKEGWTAERLRLYLKYGADPNIDNGKPLYIAAKRNCVNASRILIEHGANPNLKYEDGLTILQMIESGKWEKPDGHYSKFTDDLITLFKSK